MSLLLLKLLVFLILLLRAFLVLLFFRHFAVTEILLMRSVMQHQFSQVPRVAIPRSSFDRSHGYKTTFNAGELIPVYVDEALPGDTFSLNMTVFARLATPLHPIMDNMRMDSFFFFVPNRLIWTNFPKFFGEQDNPTDTTSYVTPKMVPFTAGALSISDYFGLPTGVPLGGADTPVMALPFRAYNLIWNQWFRDENLQNSLPIIKGDGPDNISQYTIVRRGKRHDYFTSALPWPQKGPAVTLPLGSQAPVITGADRVLGLTNSMLLKRSDTGAFLAAPSSVGAYVAGGQSYLGYSATAPNALASGLTPSNLYADLSSATAATINQLRQAFQIQRMYERDARGGTRYTEIIRSHFGVTSPDARLQRPEYLGGGSTPININPIAQTSSTAEEPTPTGSLAAMGTASMGSGFTKGFTEHGIIIGLVSLRADLNYQQGYNRMWARSTRFDFFWPTLAHIGEQTIYNREIYTQGTAVDANAFGYQERYAEYRYKPSLITGEFRSNYAQSLDTWHLAQEFSALPVLGDTFIQDNPPIDRIIAVPTEPHILFDSYFRLRCARPMPVYGVPGMIDHF